MWYFIAFWVFCKIFEVCLWIFCEILDKNCVVQYGKILLDFLSFYFKQLRIKNRV